MKKDSLKSLSVVFLALNIIFSIAYDLYYAFGYEYGLVKSNMGIASLTMVVPWIITALLIIGVLTQKKIFFCLYYGCNILISFGSMVMNIISNLNSAPAITFVPMNILSSLSSISFNLFMLFFILIVFKWKDKLPCAAHNNANNNMDISADMLVEYKGLLEQGAITQAEFDKKKNELLHL